MLTILHDTTFKNGLKVEVASAEGAMVSAPSGAMCQLAAALIESGYPADLPVRVVRADPWLRARPSRDQRFAPDSGGDRLLRG